MVAKLNAIECRTVVAKLTNKGERVFTVTAIPCCNQGEKIEGLSMLMQTTMS